jgi:uncharacterized protein YkwD
VDQLRERLTLKIKTRLMNFLVEKKSPLSMPPSFKELPVPSNQKITEENQTNSIKSLITGKKISDEQIENVETDNDFEQSIIDKIKNK